MTMPPLSDEEITAVLDGEATEDVVARVEADPVAQDRLDALRSARDAVRGAPRPQLEPAVVDSLIGRAMAEGQHPEVPGEHTPTTATPLASPRRSASTGPRWLAAAAVVVLVAIGLALVWSGTRSSDEDTATGVSTQAEVDASGGGANSDSADAPVAEDGGSDSGASENQTSEGPNTTTQPGAMPTLPTDDPLTGGMRSDGPVALGSFDNLDDLRETLRSEFPTGSASSATIAQDSDAIERCDLLMQEIFSLPGSARAVGVAEVEGTDLIVYEYEAPSKRDGSATTFVTANEPDSCDAELSFERTTS